MGRTILSYCLAAALVLLAAAPDALAASVSGTLHGTTRWEGEVELGAAVVIPEGALLRIAPATVVRPLVPEAKITVQGRLVVEGSAGAMVVFAAVPGWQGIDLLDADPATRIEGAVFDGAQTAISSSGSNFILRGVNLRGCETAIKLLRQSSPTIEGCLLEGNAIGIDTEMRSSPIIRDNRFIGHKKAAILAAHNSSGTISGNYFAENIRAIQVMRTFPGQIVNNRFEQNQTGIYCNQTQNSPLIGDNLFKGNAEALVSFSFSSPVVQGNTFTGNQVALRNDQLGCPLVAHNRINRNRVALHNSRRSDPRVEKNILSNNGLALFCDFSSYPEVIQNNFLANTTGVKLGAKQSADWEKRVGSRGLALAKAQGSQARQLPWLRSADDFKGFVDVRKNWWGKQTSLLAEAGEDANLEMFFDRHDLERVVYEESGPESYLLDQVRYRPWLLAPVTDAGPAVAPKQ